METEPWIDRERAIWKLLPLHPQPEVLESFTSYIARLAEVNGLKSIKELAALAGTNWSHVYARQDYPCPPYDGLARITGCSEARLERTTFHLIAQHLGSPLLHPQSLRQFLQGSLASTLRYCPRCLAEHSSPYYRLHWRFLAVQNCRRHNCVLLSQCGHCGAALPLVAQVPQLARCPSCQRDLRTCQASSLAAEAAQGMHTLTDDREVFLTPSQWLALLRPQKLLMIAKEWNKQ